MESKNVVLDIKYDNSKELNIFEFIKNKDYDIQFGTWFRDLWFPLFYKKDVLITNDILKFIHYGSENSGSGIPDPNFKRIKSHLLESLSNYKINYKIVKYNDPLALEYDYIQDEIKELSQNNLKQKTWIILSVKDLKSLIMRLDTKVAQQIRDYYITLEEIVFDYSKYVSEFKMNQLSIEYKNKLALEQREREMLEEDIKELENTNKHLKNKVLSINNLVIKRSNILKEQIFYIATSELYSKQNIFKVGGMENDSHIKSRKSTYNTERPKEDTFFYVGLFYCNDYRLVENFIASFLSIYKLPNKKELYNIYYDDLFDFVKRVIDVLDVFISYSNTHQNEIISNLTSGEFCQVKENLTPYNIKNCRIWINTENKRHDPNCLHKNCQELT